MKVISKIRGQRRENDRPVELCHVTQNAKVPFLRFVNKSRTLIAFIGEDLDLDLIEAREYDCLLE